MAVRTHRKNRGTIAVERSPSTKQARLPGSTLTASWNAHPT
jgi:hypothetical protein